MININRCLINKNNIACVTNFITNSDGYVYKETYHIIIRFIGDYTMELKTYDKKEFEKWWEELENE